MIGLCDGLSAHHQGFGGTKGSVMLDDDANTFIE